MVAPVQNAAISPVVLGALITIAIVLVLIIGWLYLVKDDSGVGMIAYFPYAVTDPNWCICDGSEISRSTYDTLFSKIGTVFGSGDGTNTFNLPDLRGDFIRSTDPVTAPVLSPLSQPATAIYNVAAAQVVPPSAQWAAAPNNTANASYDIANYDTPVVVGAQKYLPMQPVHASMYAYMRVSTDRLMSYGL